jgi:hypothetical protein
MWHVRAHKAAVILRYIPLQKVVFNKTTHLGLVRLANGYSIFANTLTKT